jgi:hypothetical protein
MATLSNTQYTLADLAKNMTPDGGIADVAELLSQMNQMVEDAIWIEGNLPTGHMDTVRTSLPIPTWRRLNQGVDPTKTGESQVTDVCGMQETYAVVDKRLANMNGMSAKWRLSQNKGYLEGLTQDMASQMLYANNALNPERPQGLTPRYNALSTSVSQTANNVLSGGGSGNNNTSIWLVGWADDKVRMFHGKGTPAGLQNNDLGEQAAFDANNKRYQALITHYVWEAGLSVKDWRYIVRICNIDVTSSGLKSNSPPDLVDLIDQAIARIPNLDACRPALYMNRTARRYLNKQRNRGVPSSSTVNTTTIRDTSQDDQRGVIKRFENYDGIPMRIVDQIINTEATVS